MYDTIFTKVILSLKIVYLTFTLRFLISVSHFLLFFRKNFILQRCSSTLSTNRKPSLTGQIILYFGIFNFKTFRVKNPSNVWVGNLKNRWLHTDFIWPLAIRLRVFRSTLGVLNFGYVFNYLIIYLFHKHFFT